MKKLITAIIFCSMFEARYIKKKINGKSFDIIWYHYPRWYSPFFWFAALMLMFYEMWNSGLRSFFESMKGVFKSDGSDNRFSLCNEFKDGVPRITRKMVLFKEIYG